MDMNLILIVVFSLTCLAVWTPIVFAILGHRERMRQITSKHEAWKRQVKFQVEQQIREVSGDMRYELGGEIQWQRDETSR